ncbi:hypothetical protein SFR_7040 (plasmid) [Streptomyces sp. FR-008]|nr:hypothetical protein SFR_7040 [Streptomyces sp. FR-008]
MIATAALRHAADVTHEDIGAVADFLRAALNHPDNVARPGTQAFRTNGAPRALVPQLEGSLSYQFHDELMAEAQRDRIKALERIQGIRRTWNQLIGIASFWKEAMPGTTRSAGAPSASTTPSTSGSTGSGRRSRPPPLRRRTYPGEPQQAGRPAGPSPHRGHRRRGDADPRHRRVLDPGLDGRAHARGDARALGHRPRLAPPQRTARPQARPGARPVPARLGRTRHRLPP